MSVERIWHWTCDDCGIVVQQRADGLPPGWVWVSEPRTDEHFGRLTHRCNDDGCHERIDLLASIGRGATTLARRKRSDAT